MTSRSGLFALLLFSLAAVPATAQTGGNPAGTWLTQAGDAKVRVSRCGAALCGTVVWLRDAIDPATNKPAVDDKNPDPARRKRSMIGLPIFIAMKSAGPNKWSGQIYNADDGKTYASNVSVTDAATLRVEGCVGGGLCGGENWTRAGH